MKSSLDLSLKVSLTGSSEVLNKQNEISRSNRLLDDTQISASQFCFMYIWLLLASLRARS